MSRDARLLLADIIETCEEVAKIIEGVDYERFAASVEKVQPSNGRSSCSARPAARLPEAIRDQNPQVPWRLIIGMRNILAHAYWQVDRNVLWDAATRSVPALLEEVRALFGSH